MSLILSNSNSEGPRSGAPPTTSAKAAGKPPQYVSALLPFSDALPYYDRDLDNDPSLRARVEREIAKELARGEASGSGGAGRRSVEERLGPKFEFTKVSIVSGAAGGRSIASTAMLTSTLFTCSFDLSTHSTHPIPGTKAFAARAARA